MDLIIFPFHDYKKWIKEGFRTRDAHLFQHFSQLPEVDTILVVNRPVSIIEMLVKRVKWYVDDGIIVKKKKQYRLTKLGKNTYCLDILLYDTIKVIKERKLWWFSCFKYPSVIKIINQTIDDLQMRRPCLFVQNPMVIGAVPEIKSTCFAFDAIDNWMVHPQMKQISGVVEEGYNFVDNHANVITTVSKSLLNVFPNNKNKFWISNGVDAEYFSNAINEYHKSRLVIGYVGKIQERVDFELVEKCLRSFPNYLFVFMGPIYAQERIIGHLKKKYRNIKFYGDVHYKDLPNKMKEIDITVIPHVVDKFTMSMNPLKLYEYLASGKPVVTTKVAGVERISDYVYMADTDDEFVSLINKVSINIICGNIQPESVAASLSSELKWENKAKRIAKCLNISNNRSC